MNIPEPPFHKSEITKYCNAYRNQLKQGETLFIIYIPTMYNTSQNIITPSTVIVDFSVKHSESLSNIVDEMKTSPEVPQYLYTTKKKFFIQYLEEINKNKDAILYFLKFHSVSSDVNELAVFKVSKPIPIKVERTPAMLLSQHKSGRVGTSRFTKTPSVIKNTAQTPSRLIGQLPKGRIGATRFSKSTPSFPISATQGSKKSKKSKKKSKKPKKSKKK